MGLNAGDVALVELPRLLGPGRNKEEERRDLQGGVPHVPDLDNAAVVGRQEVVLVPLDVAEHQIPDCFLDAPSVIFRSIGKI